MDWMQDTALNVSIQMGQNISLDLDQIIDCYGTCLHYRGEFCKFFILNI